MNRPIFFCHIPKAAGTSLRHALAEHFHQDDIVPNREMILANGGSYPPVDAVLAAISKNPKARLLQGHYHYSVHPVLDHPITIVILRDPLARTISHIKHNVAAKALTPERAIQLLDAGKLPVIDNQMTRMLAGIVDLRPDRVTAHQKRLFYGPVEDAEAAVAGARYTLHSVDVLGIAERYGEFLARLRDVTGVNLPEQKINTARGNASLPLTAAHIETIRAHNRLDQQVYDWAMAHLRED